MAKKLIIVIGLPASGKSTYLKELKASSEIACFFDDFQSNSIDNDPDPRKSRHFEKLTAALNNNQTIAIADIRYCAWEDMATLVKVMITAVPGVYIEAHCFENDTEACMQNVVNRGRESVDKEIQLINEYTDKYTPVSTKIIPVHQP